MPIYRDPRMLAQPVAHAGQAWRQVLRHDFASFIAKSFATVDPGATYLPNWHIDLIAEYLEAARHGEITRLLINLPPRALKSICVSVAWPAWLLGHDPRTRILCASYAMPLALKHSTDCRLVMQSEWYHNLFPQVALARDQNEKHKFTTTQRGYRFATSVGGTLTGEGGGILIIDDPLTPLQATSRTARTQVNEWYQHTFASRLDNKERGVIVVVMQRLHGDDLSGYLIAKGGFTQLCLPALSTCEQVIDFGRVHWKLREGEPMHKERENLQSLERAKRELGSQAFAAQYLQQPLPEEGGLVKLHWLTRYDAMPLSPQHIVQSWDTAIKSGEGHDASCCLTFAEQDGISYLLESVTLRAEYPDLKRTVLAQAAKWLPQAVLMEDRASGQQLLQDLKRETMLPLIPCNPTQDKFTRLAAVSAMIEAGRLRLPREAAWLSSFESELLHFPAARHDDQVDALSQYLDWARARNLVNPRLRGV